MLTDSTTGRCLEIEVTPAMLAAGINALCLFDLSQDRPEDIADEIYRSMRTLERGCTTLVDKGLSAFGDA